MKSKILSVALISTSILSSVAGARSIQIDFVTPLTSGAGATAYVNPVEVQTYATYTSTVPVFTSLTGVSSLSFSAGELGNGYYGVGLMIYGDLAAYNWGDTANPFQQVLLQPYYPSDTLGGYQGFPPYNLGTGPTSEFALTFNYATGDTALANQTASATVNGITYTAEDPVALNPYPYSGSADPFIGLEPDVLVFKGGVLQNSEYVLTHGWTKTKSTSVGAPEIDPASTMTSITVLSGGLAVLFSRPRRRAAARRAH